MGDFIVLIWAVVLAPFYKGFIMKRSSGVLLWITIFVLLPFSTASGAEILQDGEKVGEGDTLQIGYVAAGQAYGVILSVDGRGTVTVHLPSASSVAQPLDQEGIVLMPFAYQLDDAPEFERFFFVTSKEEFDLASRGCAQTSENGPPGAPGRTGANIAAASEVKVEDAMKRISLLLLIALSATSLFADQASEQALRRFAMFVGSNDGGHQRVRLKYAESAGAGRGDSGGQPGTARSYFLRSGGRFP